MLEKQKKEEPIEKQYHAISRSALYARRQCLLTSHTLRLCHSYPTRRSSDLASRKSSDSGRLRITTGIMTADATAPNTNAERQPYPVMRTAAMVPPTVEIGRAHV